MPYLRGTGKVIGIMDDKKIIELYFDRDESAISESDIKYGAYCRKIAYNILEDGDECEECVNDTYLRAWNTIPPTVPNLLGAFLGRITRNISLDRYNSKMAAKRGGRVFESLEELSEIIGDNELERLEESKEITEVINRFLEGEKELSRRIFVRKYFYGDSVLDISKRFKLTESNVKVTLHRARARLGIMLRREGVFI